MKRATLITGAAGFAGSHLLDLLAPLTPPGESLVAWQRPGSAPPASPSNVTWTSLDLLDRQAVADAVAALRPGAVYHCAGAAHVGDAWSRTEETLASNVRGTHHLLDALDRSQVAARVLVISSALVYRPSEEALTEHHALVPNSPYGLSKLAQELLALGAGSDRLGVLIARSFNHVGPRQNPSFSASGFARQIAEIEAGVAEPEIAVGNLDARRELTDVRDTVRAYRAILEHGVPGRVYNVSSGRAVAVREVLDRLLGRARVPIRVRVDPARLRPNDMPLLLGDPGRIRDELGWTARVPIDTTLDDLLDYWRQQRRA